MASKDILKRGREGPREEVKTFGGHFFYNDNQKTVPKEDDIKTILKCI